MVKSWTVVVACVTGGMTAGVFGAEKPRETARRESAVNAANASLRTQQRTGDSLAKQTGRPTSAPSKSDSTSGLKAELAALEAKIRSEDERHASAMSDLQAAEQSAAKSGKTKQAASAKKAIDKARSSHERKVAPLNEQREKLRKKLGATGEIPAKPTTAPSAKVARSKTVQGR